MEKNILELDRKPGLESEKLFFQQAQIGYKYQQIVAKIVCLQKILSNSVRLLQKIINEA